MRENVNTIEKEDLFRNLPTYNGKYEITDDLFRILYAKGVRTFWNCFFYEVSLDSWDLSGIDFSESRFFETNFQNCCFDKAIFRNCTISTYRNNCMSGSSFREADMSGATLETPLDNVNFSNMSFHGTHFHRGYLRNCELGGADFTAAEFDGTWIGGCSFSEPVLGLECISYTAGGATREEVEYMREALFAELRRGNMAQ